MKIGFFQTAFLGDLLLSVPALRQIQSWQPDAQVTVFCRSGLSGFMEKLPFVHQAIDVDKSSAESRKNFSHQIRKSSFDVLFCPHQSFRSHNWVRSIDSPMKIGFQSWWNSAFFTKRVKRPLHLPDALRQMSLLSPMVPKVKGYLEPHLASGQWKEGVPDWASMTMPREFWAESGLASLPLPEAPFICIAPGSVWNTKRWTPSGFSAVAKFFMQKGFEVLFMGAPNEKSLCDELASEVGGTSLAGQLGLWEVAQTLSQAQLMVSNDSGGQHLASLAGVPTVSIFGPTVLSLGYQPWQNQALVVEEPDLACRPCGKHGHQKCPIGTHVCMTQIHPKRVIDGALSLLQP